VWCHNDFREFADSSNGAIHKRLAAQPRTACNLEREKMIKAFLSHSTVNKQFVRSVAQHLGRQFCIVDEQAFDSATTFKASIENHLDETSVFVLFASGASIGSTWVNFEVDEAAHRVIEKTIARSLVIIIDSAVDHKALPPWLQRAKIIRANAPKFAAREIRQHIDDLLRAAQHQFFEGRTDDLSKFQKLITPIDQAPPRVIAIQGLPSIGRRTFLSVAARVALGFTRVVVIDVAEGDSLVDIAVRMANELEPYSTRAGFEAIVESIKRSSESELLERIAADVRAAIANRELPALFDDGGLLTTDGLFTTQVQRIISAVRKDSQLYLCLISSRKPTSDIPTQRLDPLLNDDIRRLIARVAGSKVPPVVLGTPQIAELADYVNGFPPSAYYAMSLVSDYGIGAVLADKNRLVDFRTGVFIRFLRQRQFTEADRAILSVLARYSPIPLEALHPVVEFDSQIVAQRLMTLIDHSLVVVGQSGLYAIADPIADAVLREFTDPINHKAMYQSLESLIADPELNMPRLSLYRMLFRAGALAGVDTNALFRLSSDLIGMAERFYHQREYGRAVEFGRLAVHERPDSLTARDYLIRAFAQESKWDEALKELAQFEKIAPDRDSHYLRGFIERKRGKLKLAIRHYLDAQKAGRTGVAIQREIAYTYYLDNNLVEAKRYLASALASKDNRIALDLAVQIATRDKNEQEARDALTKLERMEQEAFFKHRLSTVELRFGQLAAALAAAQDAADSARNDRPTFGMLAQLATCQIYSGMFNEAERTIEKLETRYKHQRIDVRLGLACRLEIARKRYAKALQVFANIQDTSTAVYKAMRRDALAGELVTSALADDVRIAYQKELDKLNKELAAFDSEGSWISLVG
jgi:tetratricopeptide (TPR) repeat protein